MSAELKVNRRILVIDDNESIHADFRKIFCPAAQTERLDELEQSLFGSDRVAAAAAPFELDSAHQGREGLARVQLSITEERPYAVAFVDMRMPPGWDGVETVENLWKVDPALHVVICTAFSDYSWAEVIRRLGNTDRLLLLKKPFDRIEVWQLANALSAKWDAYHCINKRLNETRQLFERLEETNNDLTREIDERRALESQLRHYAYFDALTGLPNRACLMQHIQKCLTRAKAEPDRQFAVLFLDLDNFKLINDTHGHEYGDALLLEVANRLCQSLRVLDTLGRLDDHAARIGGDEFVVVLDNVTRSADATSIAARLLERLCEPYELRSHQFVVSASIGVAMGSAEYDSADNLLRDADTAMYRAKSAGKSRFAVFSTGMHEAARARLQLENDLRRAVENSDFRLVYQPIVELPSGRITAFESLIRWNKPDQPRTPAEFIPVAEETGLIIPLGRKVVQDALRQAQRWNSQFPNRPPVRINVNLSRRQLLESSFPADLKLWMSQAGIVAGQINLEITETAMIEDFAAATARLEELKALGLGLHLDDFGTGYSSLSCLHRFPLDVVKIDRSFTSTMSANADYAAIIRAIVTLSHSLHMKVTVEGVETEEQLEQITQLGCDFAQGYLFSHPLEPLDASRLLAAGGPLPLVART
jgi:diguanylate cyclase